MKIVILASCAVLTGCAGAVDPLGSPARVRDDPALEADYPVSGGVICRELTGTVDLNRIQGGGSGFRCLDVGTEPLQGCLEYGDGRFSYRSPGCLPAP